MNRTFEILTLATLSLRYFFRPCYPLEEEAVMKKWRTYYQYTARYSTLVFILVLNLFMDPCIVI